MKQKPTDKTCVCPPVEQLPCDVIAEKLEKALKEAKICTEKEEKDKKAKDKKDKDKKDNSEDNACSSSSKNTKKKWDWWN